MDFIVIREFKVNHLTCPQEVCLGRWGVFNAVDLLAEEDLARGPQIVKTGVGRESAHADDVLQSFVKIGVQGNMGSREYLPRCRRKQTLSRKFEYGKL